MNPEKFHDAMNYLEDDLIAETDALRQGKIRKTRPETRRIIAWVASAACLALVLGFGFRFLPVAETGSADGFFSNGNNMEAGLPAEQIQDQIYGGAEVIVQESKSDYILRGVSCDNIYIEIPETWSYEIVKEDGGGYFLHIRPPHEEGSVRVGYWPNFGVCGTGLTTEETVIAGMDARVGTYDNHNVWSFITFGGDYVAINEGADDWWGQYGNLFMKCLETLVIKSTE